MLSQDDDADEHQIQEVEDKDKGVMLEEIAFEREWWPEQEDEAEDKNSYDSKSLRLASSFLEMLVLKSQGEIDLTQDEDGAIYAKPVKPHTSKDTMAADEIAEIAAPTSFNIPSASTDDAGKKKFNYAPSMSSMRTMDTLPSMTPRAAGIM